MNMAQNNFKNAEFSARQEAVYKNIRRNSLLMVAGCIMAAIYLIYVAFAFDLFQLISSSNPQRAVLLARDAVAHKVHVTQHLRGTPEFEVSIEGERNSTYTTPPEWVRKKDDQVEVRLGKGYKVLFLDQGLKMKVPDYGTIQVQITPEGIKADFPEGKPRPEWVNATKAKFDAKPDLARRVQVSRARIEVHRYFAGWENFFFPFNSELRNYSPPEIIGLVFSKDRLNPEIPNWKLIFNTIRDNPDWQHGRVFVALLETFLMAVLGTLTAAMVGLPLAVLAASNFTPSRILRFFVRRLFDFLRGVDMLIWSLIFIRSFGLGPLTGSLAIAFTDTGSLGKLFSEALENVQEKQMEGVKSTGANRLQFYRFGVIPQIIPIFISQGLYFLESNVRSATIIGALGAGGIGLLLVEAMNTQRSWENVFYIILLTVCLVMAMDKISSILRNKLIHGRSSLKEKGSTKKK
ncbi:MAG: phosphonate ABC transporter, permease protein PhnE [Desulfonatronovibrio sp.]